MSLSAWSWALFEGGRDPYVILVAVYVFMPYFTSVIVGDPIRGQAIVADFAKIAGLIIAITGPVLGTLVDRLGRRKPPLLAVTLLTLPLLASLWWAKPDGSGLSITAIATIAAALSVLYAYSGVIHNALLVSAAGKHAGRASGNGLMMANVIGVLCLIVMIWGFVLPGQVDWAFVPGKALFGLDILEHQPDRMVGWICAALLTIGLVPLMLFTKDMPPTGARLHSSIVPALRDIARLFRALGYERNVTTYLVARIFIADAISATALFLGVFAVGIMRWDVLETLFFAIWQSVFAGLGGAIGGRIDERFGSKLALQLTLGTAAIAMLGMMGIAPDRLFYIIPHAATEPAHWIIGPLHFSTPETVFLAFAGILVFCVTAAAGSSRTLLVRITPPEHSGAYFGLYTLAGTATAWLAPLLVATFTLWFGSQQAGFLPIVALFAAGMIGVSMVDMKQR